MALVVGRGLIEADGVAGVGLGVAAAGGVGGGLTVAG